MNNDSDYDQHQDDLGQEIRERESVGPAGSGVEAATRAFLASIPPPDEPSDRDLLGELIASLGYVTGDLTSPDSVAMLLDQQREGLVRDIAALDGVLLSLGVLRDEMAQALAGLMEDSTEAIGGHAVTRSRTDKTEWDKDTAWRQVRHAMLDRWVGGLGGITLDVEKATLVDRVMSDIATVYTSRTPTVAGLKALDINPYELRAVTPGTRWNVRVQG